jgi:hypothetical protein
MNRSHKYSVLAVMAALAGLAPLSAQAQGPAAPAGIAAADSALTPALLAKMLALVSAKGQDGKVAPRFANALGLSAPDQPWPNHQVVAGNPDANHYIAVGPGAGSEILFTARTPSGVTAIRVSRAGSLMSAMSLDVATHAITPLSPADARAALAAEWAFWAPIIDGFLGQK